MPKRKKALTNLFFELGLLKKLEHCGTKFAGIKHPDTLGEHSCRAAQIGYVLAVESKGNPEKVAAMCLFHDVGEIRVGDTHRIASKYMDTKEAEKKAFYDQTQNLPAALKKRLRGIWDAFCSQTGLDAKIAKDADLLETMFQAKEYVDDGHEAAQRWLTNGSKYLQTAAAKKIFNEMQKTRFTDWWDDLNIA